ncbi:MAG: hypothetical protein DI628_02805 [Blastochloris viridis]|uniref:Ubiquinol-cytochrome c chaperone domain-containing protein n=1 Tax=Blastochloris viridis TaxID=1079 RepID=A0A6N4R922_BLAVI|nr:MAG: hypothetical protein DI628_02805 [Blastochloris viridis]
MIFHWLKLYGKHERRATAVVDVAFANAKAASPAVFEGDSTLDDVRKAKFEHACPWLALELTGADPRMTRNVVEVMIDRIEVGLREASVGDMKVGREVRSYASALNGRLQRYVPLIEQQDWQELAVAVAEHGIEPSLVQQLKGKASKKAA